MPLLTQQYGLNEYLTLCKDKYLIAKQGHLLYHCRIFPPSNWVGKRELVILRSLGW